MNGKAVWQCCILLNMKYLIKIWMQPYIIYIYINNRNNFDYKSPFKTAVTECSRKNKENNQRHGKLNIIWNESKLAQKTEVPVKGKYEWKNW